MGPWIVAALALALGFVLRAVLRGPPAPSAIGPQDVPSSAPAAERAPESAAIPAPDAEGPIERAAIADGPRRESLPAAASEPFTIELVDADFAPVSDARARLFGEERVRVSDASGRLSFERPGVRGLLVAAGFRPVTFEVPRGRATLELVSDLGLDVHVRWEDTGEPVVGARIERVGPHDKQRLEQLLGLLDGNIATDSQGSARLYGLHLDSETLRLRFEHPRGAVTWQELGALLDGKHETPRLEVAMPRAGGGARFRVVDAAGEPLADRLVRVSWLGSTEARTGPDGRVSVPFAVRNVDPEEWSFVAVVVQLDAEDSWWWAGFHRSEKLAEETLLRVAPVRVHGRVVTDSTESWQVASANLHGHEQAPTPRSWPHADRLTWSDLAEDGSFALERGWQGVSSAVFLRTRGSALPIQAEPVPPDGSAITIVAQPTCRLSLEVADAGAADLDLAVLELVRSPLPSQPRHGAVDTLVRLEPPLRSQAVVVPRGRYTAELRSGTATWTSPAIDASVAELRVPITVPAFRRFRGTVRGSLSGTQRPAHVDFVDGNKHAWARLECDALGRFEADLPIGIGLWALASDGDIPPTKLLVRGLSLREWIAPERNHVDFVRPEAELRVVERPWNPLLADWAPRLHLRRVDGSIGQQLAEFDLRGSDTSTLLVPPGDYLVVRHLGELPAQSHAVTLADGERREIVLDSEGIGVLALEVHVEHGGVASIRVELRDAVDQTLWRHDYAMPAEGPWRRSLPLEPGSYTVRLGTFAGPPESEPPLASWSGAVDAVPGASEPTVVHLR